MNKIKIKNYLNGLNKEMKRGLECSPTGTNYYVYTAHIRRLIKGTLDLIFHLEEEIKGLNKENGKIKSRFQEAFDLISKDEKARLIKKWKPKDDKQHTP